MSKLFRFDFRSIRGKLTLAAVTPLVVVLLLVVNLTATPERWWVVWVALGWGAGVLAHAWCVFRKRQTKPVRP